MPPVYFIAVLVVAVGSVCFADEGEATAKTTDDSRSSVYCPGSSCREVCKCNSEYGPTSCSMRGDNYTILLKPGYCMNLLNGSVVIGRCPYASSKWRTDKSDHYSFRYNELFLNNSMCDDLNRHKVICSSCKEGYGIAIYSGSWYCSPCTLGGYAWLLYIALETVPVTIFFLAVVFFNVRATSPPMTGFILFNQILVTFLRNQIILVPLLKTFPNAKYILSIGLTVSEIWNLDFFRDILPHFCVTHHLTNFGMIVFRSFFAIYPFLLLMILVVCIKLYNRGIKPFVCLWKPIHRYFARHRRAFNANASLVDAMTTFLLLSYFNIATILVYFFQWTRIRILCSIIYHFLDRSRWKSQITAAYSSYSSSTSDTYSSTISANHVSIKGIQKVPCTYKIEWLAASAHVCGKVSGRLQGWHTGNIRLSFPFRYLLGLQDCTCSTAPIQQQLEYWQLY